jgi:glutaredoxin
VATVTIYSKPDCHLCERVKHAAERVRQKHNFSLEITDISAQPTLFDRYKNDIPVIFLNGREVARHSLTEHKLLELLQQEEP